MRNTGRCTKCASEHVLQIKAALGDDESIRTGRNMLFGVPVTRFLCASCGFSEEWVEGADNLAKLTKLAR